MRSWATSRPWSAMPSDPLLVRIERGEDVGNVDRKSTRLNSSHSQISYAVFCLKKKKALSVNAMKKVSTSSSAESYLHLYHAINCTHHCQMFNSTCFP